MRVEELRAQLDGLPLTGSVALPGLGGRVVRFRAARSATVG
jgi:hypothetical protein